MIDTEKDNRTRVEKAVLVGVQYPDDTPELAREHLEELAELVRTLGIEPLELVVVRLRQVQVQYLIGPGKAEEVLARARELGADCLVFDEPLSPSHQRNWERFAKMCVIDREEVILDIFAERAWTREAVLQVELARLRYSLPRLTRAWTHLSRQRGGGSTNRGEGETQIENDRRLLKRRISVLEEELAVVRRQRATGRKERRRQGLLQGAIVGYTNVGKSSLLRALSGADILVRDQLFATLDPTTRRIELGHHLPMLLTDTVGFVRKLPHSLVEAFKSTLEEAVLADFLLLVLDVSSPALEEQWETTHEVLRELGAENKRILTIFNKLDRLDPVADAVLLARLRGLFPEDSIYLSTRTGEGMAELRARLAELAGGRRRICRVLLPPTRADLRSLAFSRGSVLSEEYDEQGNLELVFSLEAGGIGPFEPFMMEGAGG